MLVVACIKVGSKYGPEYVNILARAISRHTSRPYRFICFTDSPRGLEVETAPLPVKLPGWWNKLWFFNPDAIPNATRVIALDLDIVIVDSLNWLFDYQGKFLIARDFYVPSKYNGGIWNLQVGQHSDVWKWFQPYYVDVMQNYYSDQEWITAMISHADIIQDLYPGKVLSYKADVVTRRVDPLSASIVVFHGEPKPHALDESWIKEHWRDGG